MLLDSSGSGTNKQTQRSRTYSALVHCTRTLTCWSVQLTMSARASRLRLEEELRRIVEQEESLDVEVNQLLQVSVCGYVCVFPVRNSSELLSVLAAVVPLAGGDPCILY